MSHRPVDIIAADGDVCSIVLEVPNSALGANLIGLWHRTVDGANGSCVQTDRRAQHRSRRLP
jgi:hypothetical protein